MRIGRTYLALILGGALGVLAVVITETNDERASDVNALGKAQPPVKMSERAAPTNSLKDVKDAEPNKIAGTAGDLEVESGSAGSGEEGAVSSSGVYSSAGAKDSNRNQLSPLPNETARFRSSASVQERCRTRPAPTPDSCKVMGKFLKELEREERDVEWAAQTEARIRAVVAARQDGTQIRALECRLSKCAIETESPGTQEHLSIFIQAEQEAAERVMIEITATTGDKVP